MRRWCAEAKRGRLLRDLKTTLRAKVLRACFAALRDVVLAAPAAPHSISDDWKAGEQGTEHFLVHCSVFFLFRPRTEMQKHYVLVLKIFLVR